MFPSDVPERYVDRTDRAHDGSPTEMGIPIKKLLMVLDQKRVLADQIVTIAVHHRCRCFEIAPRTRLTQLSNPCISVDTQEQIDRKNLQIRDLRVFLLGKNREGTPIIDVP